MHSLKDVPAELAAGLRIVAVPPRADPRDAIVSRVGRRLDALPAGSRVGTSSLRRVCQVRALRGDLTVDILRGNVDTRLRKVAEGVVDAGVLASAGLDRLGFSARIAERSSTGADAAGDRPGGAGAGGARRRRAGRGTLPALSDSAAEMTVAAERALLAGLGVGCRTPVAGHATLAGERAHAPRAGRPPRRLGDDPRDARARPRRRRARRRGGPSPDRPRRRGNSARARGPVAFGMSGGAGEPIQPVLRNASP